MELGTKARRGTAIVLWGLVGSVAVGCGDSSPQRTVQKTGTEQVSLPPVEATPPVVESEPTPVSVVPENVTFEEAESLYRERRYDEAIEFFAAYVERKPENPWGHYMLGLSAWKAGEHGIAEDAFTTALERDPRHVKSLVNLSRVLLDVERPQDALEKIETALEIDTESGETYRLLGRVQEQLGCVEGAIAAYRQAIVLDEQDAWSMNNLGHLYIQQERFEDALLPLARAVEIRSDVPAFHNNLGIALERTGHFIAAADAYRSALTVDATYAKSSVSLARVEGLPPEPTVETIDLTQLAQRFVDEIERWRLSSIEEPAPIATDSVTQGQPVVLDNPTRTPDEQE